MRQLRSFHAVARVLMRNNVILDPVLHHVILDLVRDCHGGSPQFSVSQADAGLLSSTRENDAELPVGSHD
jgi:hypothetical protein